MELVQLLDIREVGNNGNKLRFALFKCPICSLVVEKQLQNGKRDKSCGCHKNTFIKSSNTTHGQSLKGSEHTRAYSTWNKMRDRCNNPNNKDYKYYGGKGIKVCKEWHDFTTFKDWLVSNNYYSGVSLQIDRIDSSLGYNPSNCRLVTPKINQRNRACVILNELLANDIRKEFTSGKSLVDLASKYNVHKDTIRDIIKGRTWKN